jgi:uncharacterized membrane protein YgcG
MRRLLAAIALLLLIASPALAEERIVDFNSQVQVNRDGSLDVTETIRVRAENVAINRGIFRDFPTRYDGRRGERVRVGFDLVATERNGQSEPSKLENLPNGVRIRIGDPDVLIPVGEHTYRIRYRTTRQIGRFDGFDELYWNATGNGWEFPIDHATASIALPSTATFGERAVYTGPEGSTASNARVSEERPGFIRFETTTPLAPREGMTVAAAFPKDVVAPPASGDRINWFLADWGPPIIALGGLGGLIAYLLSLWRRVGRNPPEGTIVPLFSPPDNLSPAAMRYLTLQNMDNRAFAASLVDAGVKGHVRIIENDGGFFGGTTRHIEHLSLPKAGARPLDEAEQSSLNRLVPAGQEIKMDNEKHETFAAAAKVLKSAFDQRYEGKAFNRNTGWAFAALGAWLAALFATTSAVLLAEGEPAGKVALVAVGLISVAAIWWSRLGDPKGVKGWLIKAVPWLLLAISSAIAFPTIFIALGSGRWLPLGIIAFGLPLALSSFFWISAPTREGQKILDRIAGFKQYLSITEREKLDRMHAPEDNLETFERFLPYAIALDVENRWADRFENVLKAAMAAKTSGSALGWYSGSHNPWSDTGGFVESIGGSLSSAVSSASTAPGSSSGSGGGGSSGGGGGGGGGGGW